MHHPIGGIYAKRREVRPSRCYRRLTVHRSYLCPPVCQNTAVPIVPQLPKYNAGTWRQIGSRRKLQQPRYTLELSYCRPRRDSNHGRHGIALHLDECDNTGDERTQNGRVCSSGLKYCNRRFSTSLWRVHASHISFTSILNPLTEHSCNDFSMKN